MSGVCHIVCAGPGEVALLAEHDDGDGGVAAERFPYEPKAPVALSSEHRTMSAAATPPPPPHKNTQSATIAKMPTTSVTISPTEILVVVMRVRLPPA